MVASSAHTGLPYGIRFFWMPCDSNQHIMQVISTKHYTPTSLNQLLISKAFSLFFHRWVWVEAHGLYVYVFFFVFFFLFFVCFDPALFVAMRKRGAVQSEQMVEMVRTQTRIGKRAFDEYCYNYCYFYAIYMLNNPKINWETCPENTFRENEREEGICQSWMD